MTSQNRQKKIELGFEQLMIEAQLLSLDEIIQLVKDKFDGKDRYTLLRLLEEQKILFLKAQQVKLKEERELIMEEVKLKTDE